MIKYIYWLMFRKHKLKTSTRPFCTVLTPSPLPPIGLQTTNGYTKDCKVEDKK